MKIIRHPVLALIAGISLASCSKIEQLSPVPHIEYRSFAIFDTTDILGNTSKGGKLNFYFEDGDGDVGLKPPSANQLDSTNLFFTLYRKINNEMVPATSGDPLYPAEYRIPYMERLGQNKILKGVISVTFLYLFYSPDDTIMYDFYIMDRDLNRSNIATTSEIIIARDSIYRK